MARDFLNELLGDAGEGPMQRAQAAMRPALPKRFYQEAKVEEREGALVLLLDGKPAKTPARRALAVPTRAIGEVLAAEWNALADMIDPAKMPLTRLLNVAIDRVAGEADAVAADVANYARSDLVCYRAGEPEGLVEAETAAWDPVLRWAAEALVARFVLAQGITHVRQPESALAAVRAEVERVERPFALAGVATVTALTGSVLIALMLARGAISPDAAWAAGHVEEDWNIRQWREDAEAMKRRAARHAEFDAAASVLAAL